MRVVIYSARKGAKLQKKVWPHLFRHTRLTELAKRYTEAELRLIAGWETDSKMPGVYVHLSGRDIKDRMAVREGLKEEDPINPRLDQTVQDMEQICRAVIEEQFSLLELLNRPIFKRANKKIQPPAKSSG